jgi:tetratricopeptide (TPR) repeat protein
MKTTAAVLCSLLLAACASAPLAPPPTKLFHDELFAPPAEAIDGSAALAVSPEMREYVKSHFLRLNRGPDRKLALIEALYRLSDLRLEYDAAYTRTASQAFAARSGNCLALVMMTGALAKEIGVKVQYQSVVSDPVWARAGGVYISVGHVNLKLVDPADSFVKSLSNDRSMTVDFLASKDADSLRSQPIEERTVIAMYLNNHAVESLTDGNFDEAYWWAREAVRTDSDLLIAYTTLGVVYRNRHRPEFAEQAFSFVAQRDPTSAAALTNQALALRDLGRYAEASALQKQIGALEPNPPYSYFDQGMTALRQHRLDDARRLFTKEVDRAPYQSEFQFWLAETYAEMRDADRAADHLQKALEASTTRRDRDLYAAKLSMLKSRGLQ